MSRGDNGHVDKDGFMEGVKRRNPGQTEFIQAVQEVADDIFEFIEGREDYHRWQILRRIAEPDRIVSFRVCWEDDNHAIRVQRGQGQTTMRSARIMGASASTRVNDVLSSSPSSRLQERRTACRWRREGRIEFHPKGERPRSCASARAS